MEISVCIITKDEAVLLEKLLEILTKYPFEVVVVDTGSCDDSVKVAQRYTNSVYKYKWNDNFSDARNFSISKANNNMVLILDTDEMPLHINYEKLIELAENNKGRVGRLERVNIFTRNKEVNVNSERINRFFDKNLFEYRGLIHEQVESLNSKPYLTYEIPVKVEHLGYDGTQDEIKRKALRNIELLKKSLLIKEDPYILYQLGKSYYMIDEYYKALEYYEHAIEYDLDPRLEYVEDLVISYGYTLINIGQTTQALMLENLYDEFAYSSDFVFLMGHIYMNNEKFDKAVEQFLKATQYTSCKMLGVNSYLAYYNIGVIYECLGYIKEALDYYNKCSQYKKAADRIKVLMGQIT